MENAIRSNRHKLKGAIHCRTEMTVEMWFNFGFVSRNNGHHIALAVRIWSKAFTVTWFIVIEDCNDFTWFDCKRIMFSPPEAKFGKMWMFLVFMWVLLCLVTCSMSVHWVMSLEASATQCIINCLSIKDLNLIFFEQSLFSWKKKWSRPNFINVRHKVWYFILLLILIISLSLALTGTLQLKVVH